MIVKVENRNISDTSSQNGKPAQNVYYGVADNFLNDMPALYKWLSDEEKKKADRFRLESDYLCFVSAHAFLRTELSKKLGLSPEKITITQVDHGKPYLLGRDVQFSLSRSKRLFVFTISNSDQLTGIDIEKLNLNFDIDEISKRHYSLQERTDVFSFVKRSDQQRSFFEIWTRKEALLKAIGIGINTDLRKVQVIEGTNKFYIEGVKPDFNRFYAKTFALDEAVISVVSTADFLPCLVDLSKNHD